MRETDQSRAGMTTVTLAIALMGFAAVMSSVMHVGIRLVSTSGLAIIEVVFLRTLLTLVLTLPFVFRPGHMAWRSTVPWSHVARGGVGMLSMWSWYYALANLPLGLAVTLGQTTALFLVGGAALWFRERVGVVRWSALVAGLVGAMIALQPGGGAGMGWPAMIAIASSALWALSLLMAKDMTRYDSPLTVSFYQPLTIMPLSLIGAIPVWVTPTLYDLAVLTMMAAAAGLSNFCSIKALGLADASITAPIDYTKILWTTTAAYVLFAEVPGVAAVIGGALILAATLMITIYERRPEK